MRNNISNAQAPPIYYYCCCCWRCVFGFTGDGKSTALPAAVQKMQQPHDLQCKTRADGSSSYAERRRRVAERILL